MNVEKYREILEDNWFRLPENYVLGEGLFSSTTSWMFWSGWLNSRPQSNKEFVAGLEIGCSLPIPVQPDWAWANLQRRME